MRTKSLMVSMLLLALSAILVACGSAGGPGGGGEPEQDFRKDLQLGTGSTGGTYFPLGGEMATVLSDNVKIEGFNVSAVESGASVENLAKIGSSEMQLGMTVDGTAVSATEGTGEFEGQPIKNFGFVTHIYPEILHVVTLESTGIESIEDLEGKRVAIGPPGSATRTIAPQVLSAYGIEEEDYQAFDEDFGPATSKLQDGNLDAFFAVLGAPAANVDELQATTGEAKYLEIEGDALEQITSETFYEPTEIPADTYSWLDSPVSTVTARAILIASTNQVSEDVGYAITKTLLEDADQISHPQAENITMENALKGSEGLPLHPGAERYYKEKGLLDK